MRDGTEAYAFRAFFPWSYLCFPVTLGVFRGFKLVLESC